MCMILTTNGTMLYQVEETERNWRFIEENLPNRLSAQTHCIGLTQGLNYLTFWNGLKLALFPGWRLEQKKTFPNYRLKCKYYITKIVYIELLLSQNIDFEDFS